MLKRTCAKRLTPLSHHAERLMRVGRREESNEVRKAIVQEHRARSRA